MPEIKQIKLAIVGSRSILDEKQVNSIIESTIFDLICDGAEITHIVSGGAVGVDTIAEKYADNMRINKIIIKPDWDRDGKSAAFKRNTVIAKACDMMLVIHDPKSKTMGCLHAKSEADKLRKKTILWRYTALN